MAKKVVEPSLERSRRDKFKPILQKWCQRYGKIYDLGTTRDRKVVEVSLERSRRDEFEGV